MTYCILRTKKLKTFGAVVGSAQHTYREQHTPNADPALTHRNWHAGASSSASLLAALRARLPEKRRKDAVIVIEYLIAASPEFFVKQADTRQHTRAEYFNASIKFLRDMHGQENVIGTSLHLDESTPHLIAYVVPLNSAGRLCAKDFLGGRQKLTQLQTSFHSAVGQKFGLERGVEGSRAVHQRVKQFYTRISQGERLTELSKADKVAELIGVTTPRLVMRKAEEKAIFARSVEYGRTAVTALKAACSAANARLAKVTERLKAMNAELTEERQRRHRIEADLVEARKKIAQVTLQAVELYQVNQRIAGHTNPSRISTSTIGATYDQKTSKPVVAN